MRAVQFIQNTSWVADLKEKKIWIHTTTKIKVRRPVLIEFQYGEIWVALVLTFSNGTGSFSCNSGDYLTCIMYNLANTIN